MGLMHLAYALWHVFDNGKFFLPPREGRFGFLATPNLHMVKLFLI